MAVYLIHFEPAYRHARHYLGYADNVQTRYAQHVKGQGAQLTRMAVSAGSKLVLARTWPGGNRKFERELKNRKNTPKLCPICNPEGAYNANKSRR